MPRTPVRNWFLIDEVADRLGVSKRRVHMMLTQGFFPNADQAPTGTWLVYGKDIDAVEQYRKETPPVSGRKGKNKTPAEKIRAIQRSIFNG